MRTLLFRSRRGIAVIAASMGLAVAAAPASAQLGSWQEKKVEAIGDQAQLRLTGTSGVVSTFSNPSVYVGGYAASFASDPTRPSFTVYCIDFLNTISVGTVWTANVSHVVSGALDKTRMGLMGVSDALVRYQKAIWLAQQFAVNQTRAAWTGIHDAIWATVNPGDGLVKTTAGAAWLGAVNTAFASGAPTDIDWSSWRVVTDVRATGATGGTQEFIVHVAPEPASVVLLLSGLLLVGFLARRGRRATLS